MNNNNLIKYLESENCPNCGGTNISHADESCDAEHCYDCGTNFYENNEVESIQVGKHLEKFYLSDLHLLKAKRDFEFEVMKMVDQFGILDKNLPYSIAMDLVNKISPSVLLKMVQTNHFLGEVVSSYAPRSITCVIKFNLVDYLIETGIDEIIKKHGIELR